MSRVLRRPMFRGGIANSEGTGITSGLENPRQGYADGPTDIGVQQSLDYGLNDYYENLYKPKVERPITQRERLEQIIAEREKQTSGISPRERLGLPLTTTQEMEKEGIKLTGIPVSEQQKLIKQYEQNKADKKAQELKDKTLKDNKNNQGVFKNETTVKNLPSFYDEYMSMINKANLIDQDELTKQKYLELAKFGLNLMGQPGGLPGGKRDLFGAISRAAEKPLEGYSNILARESQMKQLPKQLALQASINAMAPGQIEKSIRELSKYMPLERAIGIVAKENTSQQRALDMQEAEVFSGKLATIFPFLTKKENKGALDTAGQSFLNWKKIDPNLTFGQLSQIPADKELAVDKKYYIGPNGTIVRFDKRTKQYLEAGDVL
jgi:hypothetical protein